MNFERAESLLTGRCVERRKLKNNTYLIRRGADEIAVRLHSTDIITLHRDGSTDLDTGGWETVTTLQRIREFADTGVYHVGSERGTWFVWKWGRAGDWRSRTRVVRFGGGVTIHPDGSLTGGADFTDTLESWREADRARRKLQYWLRAARGVGKRDATNCKGGWCACHHPRRGATLGECECGCIVPRKKFGRKLTWASILAEENASVRVAQIACYGFDRFVLDAGADVLDKLGEYELLSLKVRNGWHSHMRALKMTCPSTRTVYISPVSPDCHTVNDALDWMYDTRDYLGQVTQQS